ncbi:magnesium transporter MgtE N-terminal domain-containing protein [Streptomyces albidoflavus]|jgi:flagellar motility protein MotE (MotC chaperone)/sporulation protein YlmC with PRC-barrel domain|uniref:Magnesium transporter n=5 Tax=Streptomyces TaxID=1883 RepID=A0A126Y0U1_9ACTN|nr:MULTISPECIES: CBS domain-containing protein [Streptomyces]MBO1284134.1 magnesium transporter [Streptomyces sampsonii]MYQ75346.1 CBS domain-containing protein [Streptomyces sp. SID4934]MYW61937.1 CBS domain-containing protein [Streptomyces sp. SID8370]MYW87422.1 CBS domain-containing protein [Streptomyces sp. SID8371]MYX50164.1 CBS domain-containing protein [Streptomyces sp. SID8385]MYX83197.1 CBS domain-containing protein [Streptomyces sp. SID4915]NVI31088.1 magnesium transporter [Strepto
MAGGTPRIFVSHLSGVAVFDPNGDQVGRVRDLVAMLRVGRRPPRLLGLVVEVATRRRIFLPITRVTGIESGQVITTGVLNVRRFEQRPTERLVIGELLDRRVRLLETDEEATVLDVSIRQLPARRDWEIDRVFVRKGRGGALRRRGETLTVEWSAVTGFSLEEEGQGAESLLATFEQLRPADLANVLHHLSPKRRAEVAAALQDDRLADVLEELPEDDQIEILGKLKEERAADVLEAMDPDDAADLLAELPEEEKERLLTLMQPGDAADVRRLMAYEERTAGGLMTTEPVVVRPDSTVADALARVRNPDLSPALAAQVYVCRPPDQTPTGKYLGTVHFQRLLRDPPYTLVSAMLDDDLQPLSPETPLRAVAGFFATYDIVAAAVVDESGSLLGAVTVDDVLDHLLPDDWRETEFLLSGEENDE